ncbi:MAG: type II toxin-antitoxin system RelE/ParE family toxin [Coleofasciculaceae cyanobacterium SM2_1_6]|nr:type II toxin-antitoxin system RelE/ParE family toxin [Coleofasciculaceae cyanobacterium SM2_1_6]
MYEVQLSTGAQNFYKKTSLANIKKINKCLENLEKNPYNHPNITALRGNLAGRYRYRIGDYRVLYRVDEELKLIFILLIAHRSKVYDS